MSDRAGKHSGRFYKHLIQIFVFPTNIDNHMDTVQDGSEIHFIIIILCPVYRATCRIDNSIHGGQALLGNAMYPWHGSAKKVPRYRITCSMHTPPGIRLPRIVTMRLPVFIYWLEVSAHTNVSVSRKSRRTKKTHVRFRFWHGR